MSGRRAGVSLRCLVAGLMAIGWGIARSEAAESSATPASTNLTRQLLKFLDGGLIHGSLMGIGRTNGVGWEFTESARPLRLSPDHLAWIRFPHAPPAAPATQPTCRLRFVNGDEVFGQLIRLDQKEAQIKTWFGGDLVTDRHSLRSAVFLNKGYVVRYEGPDSLDGWTQGRGIPLWQCHEGALITRGIGMVGRDMGLSDSSSIEFDLGWSGQFSMVLCLYSEVSDRLEYIYNRNSYMLTFSAGFATAQRIQGGAGTMQLGYASVPQMQRQNPVHVELRTSKEEATLTLLVNGELVQRWKDSNGFIGQGSGIIFYSQMDGCTVRVSNLRVSEWDVRLGNEPEALPAPTHDTVFLANRDSVNGRLDTVEDGRILIEASGAKLTIPLERMVRIAFAESRGAAGLNSPWTVRAFLTRGGNVSFDLDTWGTQGVLGKSRLFGDIKFQPESIRRLLFNLQQTDVEHEEAQLSSEDTWEFNE